MKEFKAGDEVVVIRLPNKSDKPMICNNRMVHLKGSAGKVVDVFYDQDRILVEFSLHESWYFKTKHLSLKTDYPKSNRKKLHDYIKSTGYTSIKLGESVGNKWYFSNITKKSRLDSRGDISEKTLIANIILAESAWMKLSKTQSEKQSTVSDESVSEARKEEIIRELDLMQGRTVIVNNYQEKQANWIKLNKIAFLICILFLISILTILYSVVSK